MANKLYAGLVAAQYSMEGADSLFLSSLCRSIPFVPGRSWEKTGILAEIPAHQVANLKRQISHHGRIIKRLRIELAEL